MQFILDKQQRDLYKKSWKKFLTDDARELKRRIRIGFEYRATMTALHILRHILLVDVTNIDKKIIKAFRDQKLYPGMESVAYHGLRTIAYRFKKGKAATDIAISNDFKYHNEFIKTLTEQQIVQIEAIALSLSDRYQKGLISNQ